MYITAHFDKDKNIVRTLDIINGETHHKVYNAEYHFYIPDPTGRHVSTFGEPARKLTFTKHKDFMKSLMSYRKKGIMTFEGDVRPLFKTLEREYPNTSAIKPKKSYFDIETGFDQERGYSTTSDPFNPVTAITIYNDWEETLYALAIKPEEMPYEDAEEAIKDFPNTVICDNEEQLFTIFFELTKDTHIYATWNGRFYDIPMLINRGKRIMGEDIAKKFCLWDYEPIRSTVEKYGNDEEVYDLVGKVHLDLMELYQKFTYSELPSYSLDYVSEYELDERKVAYSGSIDHMYRNDFRRFIDYARQDTMLLYKLDKKLDHISLAYSLAHEAKVDIKTVMGAVALTDNAIVLEAHNRNMILRDKDRTKEDKKTAGAWVAHPITGLHTWVGSVDLTSLYPSIFRALNLGSETILGQVRHTITDAIISERMGGGMEFVEAWADFSAVKEYEEIQAKSDTPLIIDFEDGSDITLSASEIYDFVYENDLILTANGTIIRKDVQSIISSLLTRWFHGRKKSQNISEMYEKLAYGYELPQDFLDKIQ